MSRLWERRAEVYESVFCQADWWREVREDMAGKVGRDKVVVAIPPPLLSDDDQEKRQTSARLLMYGERRVHKAYERCRQADRQYFTAHFAWLHAASLNLKVHEGSVPAHQEIPGPELVYLKKAAESANDNARAEQEKLETVVAKAVGRLPRYERQAWRRPRANA